MRTALTSLPSRRMLLAALAASAPGVARAQGLRSLLPKEPAAFSASFAGGRDTTGWLASAPGGSLVLRGRLNGAPVRVLLDSGAGASLVDVQTARALGLRASAARRVDDGAGLSRPGADLLDVELTLGSLRLVDLHTVAVDLPPLIEGPDGASDPLFVLGREAFERLLVEIDGPGGRVAFHAPAAASPPTGAHALPLTRTDDLTRRFPVAVEGSADVSAQFDTGSQSPLVAQQAFAEAHGWLSGRPTSTWIAGTVAGVREERTATLRSLSIAGFAIAPPPVETVATWDRADTPLVVGLPVLSRFRLMTDYAHDRLWLAPDPQALRKPFRKDRSGLAVRPLAGSLQVAHVAARSPASAGGWRVGERIAEVDGFAPGSGLPDGPAGRTLTLTLAGGERRRLTLADYF